MVNIYGLKTDFKLIEKRGEYYIIRWGFTPVLDEEGQETDYAYWSEEWIKYKPTLGQVKHIILTNIDKETDDKIMNGFMWEIPGQEEVPDMEKEYLSVSLDSEMKLDLIAVYTLAALSQGANLPFTLKSGPIDAPKYYTFNELSVLTSFYTSAMKYVNDMYEEGWTKKDSNDWNAYQQALDELDEESNEE